VKATILSTGDEIVRGRTLDRNAPEIAVALAREGVTVIGMTTVGDHLDDLVAAVRRACHASDVVVMSGGLGPTEDDCTRAAAARAAGVQLHRDAALEAWLRARWAERGIEMPESNLRQAELPEGAEAVPNAYGTAPGFRVVIDGCQLFAIPGPPREMRGVLADEVLPRIRTLAGNRDHVVRTRTLETFGARESDVGERIADLMERDAWPRVGTTAARGTIRVVLHAEGPEAEVEALLSAHESELRGRLGNLVFGVDGATLPEVVGAGLLATGTTVSFAESCTGGLVAGALTEIPGISAVFPGSVVTYSNAEKIARLGVPADLFESVGAVSEEVARAMAEGVRARHRTDLGVGITGIAGPDGGTAEKPVGTVHLALASADGTTHRRVVLPGDRALVRELAVKCALDLVRRRLGDPA
jgi:nicotinamide-nucleotide amidase